MKRLLLALGIVLLILACNTTHQIIGPEFQKCPPLDSALAWARRDSFPSPLYCPLFPDSTP